MLALAKHQAAVMALVFSPDGRWLASAGKDQTICLWQHGNAERSLEGHPGTIHALAFSPDSRMLASGGDDGQARIWEIASGRLLTTLPTQRTPISGLTFWPDASTLAVATGLRGITNRGGSVSLWDIRSGTIRNKLRSESQGVWALTGSRSQRTLVWSTGDRKLALWGPTSLEPHLMPLRVGASRSLTLDSTASTLVACVDWTIKFFDLGRRQERFTLRDHKGLVTAVAFHPDGRSLLSASRDRTVKLWDVTAGANARCTTYDWSIGAVLAVSFAPDGLSAAAAGESGAIQLWDLDE